jgi:hypothetical protein
MPPKTIGEAYAWLHYLILRGYLPEDRHGVLFHYGLSDEQTNEASRYLLSFLKRPGRPAKRKVHLEWRAVFDKLLLEQREQDALDNELGLERDHSPTRAGAAQLAIDELGLEISPRGFLQAIDRLK